ncbi:MAG TPA: IS256 family transposase [Actinomycetes bacterium]|jgi:putative transposase|nr:IS256 family transposase [Actinomycetes bacterium]
MLKVVADDAVREDLAAGLDEIVREGARRMLAAALEEEVAAYIAAHVCERDEQGRRLVVRNGHARPRLVTTAAGAVEVRAPRVEDRRVDEATGERKRFRSAILPPWCRKSPKVTEVLPLLYLHGLSSKDFVPALEEFFGSSAGLSAAAITRLTEAWQEEYRRFAARDLSGADYVYVWVDGIHFGVRLDQDRVCTLVIIGVRADGKKELVALTDGHRESTESWAGLLRDCKRRGMRAPVLAVGDGALGFWAALREVFPETKQQRDWVHKVMNVLDCLPKSAQPAARKALAQIRDAEDRAHAEKAVKEFAAAYRAKYPKAVAKITEDKEQLLAFFDFPAEHWVHLKTSNPIESTFATVRLRTRVTKGPGSRAAGLAMVFKLVKAAEDRWRYVNSPHLVALVRAGATFEKGVLIERPDEAEMKDAA